MNAEYTNLREDDGSPPPLGMLRVDDTTLSIVISHKKDDGTIFVQTISYPLRHYMLDKRPAPPNAWISMKMGYGES